MALPPVVAVEIGTSKTIALVGEMRDDGHVMVTGMGEQTSMGVRKGEIIDFENAVTGVRAALEKAEENGSVSIRQVYLAVSGGHIQSVVNRGLVPVGDKDGEVMDEDIEQVMNVARAVSLPPEREMLHTICQNFCIDDQERVVKPEGMAGARLSLDMLVLHGLRTRLHNTVRVVRSVPVDILDVAFSGLCSALSVLTPEQKQGGVVVIDLGGGITDYLAYSDGVVAGAGALAVGLLDGHDALLQPRHLLQQLYDSRLPWLSVVGYALFAVAVEETLFRRFFTGQLVLRTGSAVVAGVVPALCFGFIHASVEFLPPADPLLRGALMTGVGLVWGWLYLKRGLAAVVVSHLAADLVLLSWPLWGAAVSAS